MPATTEPAQPSGLAGYGLEDLIFAARHLEDLEVFAGQRSRLHPGPGWAPVLQLLRQDLATVRAELARRPDLT